MKDILMVMKYYLNDNEHPPFPKFNHQMNSLIDMGFQVYYLGIENRKIYLCSLDKKELVYEIKDYNILSYNKLYLYSSLYKAIIILTKKGYHFEKVYLRYMPVSLEYKKMLFILKKCNSKIIIELPTFPIEREIKADSRLFRKLFFSFSHWYFKKQAKYVDLFTLIGESTDFYLNRPAINIENGIYINNIKMREYKKINVDMHILGLANVAKWHGYDRIVRGLSRYKELGGKRNVIIHFIGNDGDGSLNKLKKLSVEKNLISCVKFEGPIYGSNLNSYFDKCAIAIGSLGLHRIDYSNVSTLKVKEYMARGIPFIQGALDQSNINDNYFMKIPNDDSDINIQNIIDFYDNIEDWEVLSKSMREYAKTNMTWESQFNLVFKKLEGNI